MGFLNRTLDLRNHSTENHGENHLASPATPAVRSSDLPGAESEAPVELDFPGDSFRKSWRTPGPPWMFIELNGCLSILIIHRLTAC